MKQTYIIAEIGQNHNGDLSLAKKLIDIAVMPIFDFFSGNELPGVDAVKFVKRDLEEELTDEAANRPYQTPHSFGKTYLEHRQMLELSVEEHKELELYAHSKGLDFIETLCSPGCLDLLDSVDVDAIKVASRDVTNLPLLEKLAESGKRIIVSSGMSDLLEVQQAVEILSSHGADVDILHCVSQYPAEYSNINLRSIPFLKNTFPDHTVGYSDHSIGIVVPVVSVSLGAEIIEKHITLNRQMKGSDHAGSIEPEGLWRMVRDIRNIEIALGENTKKAISATAEARKKLSRSLSLQISLSKGDKLSRSHLCMRSPGTGLPWDAAEDLIGKRAVRDLPGNSLIHKDDFQ